MSEGGRFSSIVSKAKQEAALSPDSASRSTTTRTPKRGPRPPELRGNPKSREGKKGITVFYPPEVHDALRDLAHAEKTTNNALIGEAIDLLMRARGLHPFGAR